MKIIVAGTGKVGNLLADQLTRDGHDLVVIDKDSVALEAALEQYDVMSIEGNSASVSVLRAANIEQTDLLIAATGEDETNLLAAQVRQLLLVHGGDLESLHDHLAGRRGVEPGHAMHERGLAGTGRAHDGGHFTAFEFHIHMIQRHHFVVF